MMFLTVPFVHPRKLTPLISTAEGLQDAITGEVFPVVRGIPRFCSMVNYAESFGFQWNLFDRTQLDQDPGIGLSERRFYATTGWHPSDLSRGSLLEVGSGAGRFSEVILRTSSMSVLYSVDYSSAVDTNKSNNGAYGERLRIVQASIYELPFPDNSFDKVFCLGVLQHTPSFSDSVLALIRKVRIGGEIVVDFYPQKGWYTKVHSKYLLRPITRRISKNLLLKLIRLNISWMLKVFDLLCLLRLSVLTRFIPITDIRSFPDNLSSEQRREWAIMDTFDGFSPRYDNPQRLEDVILMFTSRGCQINHAGFVRYSGGSAMVVRAKKTEAK